MKRYIYIGIAAILTLGILMHCFVYDDSVSATSTGGKEKPIYSVETDEKKIAISFDAAWGADKTRNILDILDSYEVHATFFLVGFWVEKYPEMVKEIYDRGHEIGNHSRNHPQMSKLSKQQMIQEITSVNEQIEAITGQAPTVFRPPYGDYSDAVVLTLRELNMHAIQWSIDSLDWKEYGRQPLVDRVLKKVCGGDIILFHNNAKYTPEALPEILENLTAQGYAICSISELIYTENYTVDMQGIQHKCD